MPRALAGRSATSASGLVGFLDLVAQVLAEAVERRAALRRVTPGLRHGGEALGVVRRGEDRLGDVAPDLGGADVEGGGDLDVADVIAAELDVHQPRHRLVRRAPRR